MYFIQRHRFKLAFLLGVAAYFGLVGRAGWWLGGHLFDGALIGKISAALFVPSFLIFVIALIFMEWHEYRELKRVEVAANDFIDTVLGTPEGRSQLCDLVCDVLQPHEEVSGDAGSLGSVPDENGQ